MALRRHGPRELIIGFAVRAVDLEHTVKDVVIDIGAGLPRRRAGAGGEGVGVT